MARRLMFDIRRQQKERVYRHMQFNPDKCEVLRVTNKEANCQELHHTWENIGASEECKVPRPNHQP